MVSSCCSSANKPDFIKVCKHQPCQMGRDFELSNLKMFHFFSGQSLFPVTEGPCSQIFISQKSLPPPQQSSWVKTVLASETKSSKSLVCVDDHTHTHSETRANMGRTLAKRTTGAEEDSIFNPVRTRIWLTNSGRHCRIGLSSHRTNLESVDFSGALAEGRQTEGW